MGTISSAKLAGTSLILGPLITTICYFIQQISAPTDSDSYGDVSAIAKAIQDGGSIITITSVIIPLSLTMLVYGIFFILSELRGNGEALVGYARIPMLIGLAGWTYTAAIGITITNWADGDAGAFITIWGVGQAAQIMFGLGFTAAFLAIASRDEYNSTLAYIAAAIALLATILSIVQLVTNDATTASTMGLIVGITYIIHTIYAIYLGRGLLSRA